MSTQQLRERLQLVLSQIEEHDVQKKEIFDLFKQLKTPPIEVKEVKVKDAAEEARLASQAHALQQQVANLKCQLAASQAALAKYESWFTLENLRRPLPEPNITCPKSDIKPGQWTEAGVRGMTMNPIYAGLGPFPAIIDDQLWVGAACRVLKEDGPVQFLVNLLFCLRDTFSGYEAEELEKSV